MLSRYNKKERGKKFRFSMLLMEAFMKQISKIAVHNACPKLFKFFSKPLKRPLTAFFGKIFDSRRLGKSSHFTGALNFARTLQVTNYL